MKTKRKTGKFLSFLLSFVLAIGALPVMPGSVTAKADVIREVAVTIDLPKAEERISACGTPTVTSDIYTVEVYKWLEGSYGTAEDVSAAISDGTKVLTNTDTLEEKKSYTVLFQATTYGSAGNTFQGDGMSLSVNGENALFVKQISSSLGAQKNIVIFAYSFTIPEIVEYNLKIGGIKVKSNNLVIDQKDTPTITSGSFTFDPSTYTLTMDNVVASGDFGNYFLQYSGDDDLTIQVVGTNTVIFTAAGWQGIRSDGKGNLRITSGSDGVLLIKGTKLQTGIYFYNNLVLDGSLKLTCNISNYDSAIGLRCDSGGSLIVEDDVKLFVYTDVDENASSPVSQGISAKVVMNGGNVNIESYGAVSNGVLGIGPYTEINGGVLTVACEYRAVYGSISFNYPGAKPKITASTNLDGSDPVAYNSSNHSSYKYINVEKGDPKTAIDSLTLDTLYKPVAGEMPAYPAFSDGTDNIYYDWNWYIWNTEAGTWDPFYDEEEEDSVGDSVFREGEKYALKLFVYPKRAYTFPATMTVVHNEMDIPNYDELNPNATYKKISSSGSSLELFITGDDMPVSTKNPVNSAEITINGFHHGKNVEDITVTLDAAGADFYKDAEALPNGWYLAIDNDCDGEVDGFATGALQVEADYYLAASMKAKEGYRVSSLTKEKITLNDGTASIGEIMMCNASTDMAEIVYKLPKLNYNIASVPVQPATMEADGQKTHYQCSECHEKFLDAAGSQPATEESLKISKVASVAFTQSEYDYTTEYAAKGWAQHIVVKDSDGKQLTIGTDYSVKQIGENLFGVCSAKVEGKGNYNFNKEISCTVHPSSTLRFPDDINKLNHGSYAINLYNSTKTCVINGDERIMSYGSLAALIEVDKKIGTPSEKTFDLDKDGSADLKVEMDPTSVCEGGAPISFEVLSTCSVKENKTFTLSDYAEEFLKSTLSVPYYDNITFHFVYPCASGHSYGDAWNKDATGHWRVCSVCGKTETVAEHTYDEGKVTTPATETEKGVKTYTCTVCGTTKTESIPETGKKEEATPGTGEAGGEAPGEVPGTEIKDESGSGEYVVTTDPAAPGEGGDAAVPTVEYKAPADTSEKTVTVPATIEAGGVTYQVTAIADNAFKNNKNLTTVKIDSNVVSIGKNAFYGCKNLKKVTIGHGVTTIGSGAFSGCSKLKTLTIGKNVATIGDKVFYKCTSLTKVTIPAKVSKIGKQAFYGCTKLKTVIIKTTKLTSKNVAKNAFGKNAKKVTVTLPKLAKSKKTAYQKMLKTKGLKAAKFK